MPPPYTLTKFSFLGVWVRTPGETNLFFETIKSRKKIEEHIFFNKNVFSRSKTCHSKNFDKKNMFLRQKRVETLKIAKISKIVQSPNYLHF